MTVVRVYLDYNATSPLDPRVIAAMAPFFTSAWGNSASRDHSFGWDAADAVDDARSHVAKLINARPDEIVFTSCATESINMLKGLAIGPGMRVLTSAAEHEAVLSTFRSIGARESPAPSELAVDVAGAVDPDTVAAAFRDKPGLIGLTMANNEIGTLYSLRQLTDAAHAAGALFFSDITQAVGRCLVDVRDCALDLASFSAHKLCGPKGVGALFIRGGPESDIALQPLIAGGGHERGARAGTLNVPAIVGFGEACRIATLELETDAARVRSLRDRFEHGVTSQLRDVWVNGGRSLRLTNTSNLGFKAVEARTMIRDMHDIAVSTRSACSSGDSRPSHVLKAIGLSDEDAFSCIRFSLGRFTTQDEIDYTIEKVVTSAHKLRNLKSLRAN